MELNERIEIRIEKATKEKLIKVANKRGIKPSNMARILLKDALDKVSKQG